MVWSSDVLVESKQLQPCWNYLLVWACRHLQRQLTAHRWAYHCCCQHCVPFNRFLQLCTFTWQQQVLCWWVILSCFSWDESSSISSGLSDGDGDGSENLSSEEFNASSSLNSLPSTPLGSRRNSSVMVSWNTILNSLWHCFALVYLVFFFYKSGASLHLKHSQCFPLWFILYCLLCFDKATKRHHRPYLCH